MYLLEKNLRSLTKVENFNYKYEFCISGWKPSANVDMLRPLHNCSHVSANNIIFNYFIVG